MARTEGIHALPPRRDQKARSPSVEGTATKQPIDGGSSGVDNRRGIGMRTLNNEFPTPGVLIVPAV